MKKLSFFIIVFEINPKLSIHFAREAKSDVELVKAHCAWFGCIIVKTGAQWTFINGFGR